MSSEIPSAVHAEEVVAPEAKQPGADGGNQQATEIENGSNRVNNLAKIEVLGTRLSNDDVTTNSTSSSGHVESNILAAENVKVDNFIIRVEQNPRRMVPDWTMRWSPAGCFYCR